MTPTALYARSARSEPTAPQDASAQTAHLHAHAAAHAWPVDAAHVFVDAGASGATLTRPALAALRQAVASGAVGRVVVMDMDRLARGAALQLQLLDEFARQGCEVVCVNPPAAAETAPEVTIALRTALEA